MDQVEKITKFAGVQVKSYLYTAQNNDSCIIKMQGTKKSATEEVDLKAACSNLMKK